MSTYFFSPSPTFGISEHAFATYDEAFTDDELAQIVKYGDSLRFSAAKVGPANDDPSPDIRISKVAWIPNNDTVPWLYDRLAFVARQLNGQFYRFDLSGFQEDLQYTVYAGEEDAHYGWHTDAGGMSKTAPPRKFSMVLQLTDETEYEGGELQLLTGQEPVGVTKKRGLIAAFPSYVLHRVTPVTKGLRKSLVVWASGPSFK